MNPSESQSDSLPQETYFDPEGPDSSEEEFSASLEAAAVDLESRGIPRFVVDSSEEPGAVEPLASRPAKNGSAKCEQSDVRTCDGRPSIDDASVEDALRPPLDEEPAGSDWRNLVSAKVKNYKSRKPRRERYPSLQLQFEPGAPWKVDKTGKSVPTFSQSVAAEIADFPQRIREAEPRLSMEATARVLEFPHPFGPQASADQLAEPVIDRPRILEAPELLPPPPALGGILIEPHREAEPEQRPGFDTPLQAASLSRRVLSGVADSFVIAVALAAFGYIFLRLNGSLPQLRIACELTTSLSLVLWFAYHYAFLVLCGTTPGLRIARLKISRFDGSAPPRNLRRWRVLASVLSCVSLGLGYAWCFLDEDQLSWHDRITRTHLAPRN